MWLPRPFAPYNKDVPSADIVIAGAGVIGLSTALEISGRGLRVVVVERARAMGEASWAAAGMLAAHDPENPEALRALSELSLSLYPGFLQRLESLSGRATPFRTRTALQGSRRGQHFSDGEARAGRRVTDPQIASMIPGLLPGTREFLELDETSLDPRDLCAALPVAVQAAGVQLLEETEFLWVQPSGSGVAVETSRGIIAAKAFVNCCGAWAGQVPMGGAEMKRLPLEPRKGQIVTVRVREPLRYVVRTPETYLVPRGDGRVVIGATVERAGFDKAVQAEVVRTLVAEAAALWPPIGDAEMVESWAGLRPGSSDGLPVLGPCGAEGCWLATGHFRNGILLAPATARVMSQWIAGEAPQVDLSAFSCDRFAALA